MANWLLDYIEMTEYIPSELREQLTSIRELDLQVHNAMDELERDVEQFFSKINLLSLQERQSQYDAFLEKCDVASRAASDKVKVADKLHDLVEKSMRLLDQGLEKLKEDLLEGDKAYVVEDLERKSQELDEQTRLEYESMMLRQSQLHEHKNHPNNHKSSCNEISHHNNNNINNTTTTNSSSNSRNSQPAQHNLHNHQQYPNHLHHHHHHHNQHQHHHQRVRNNSTSVQNTAVRQKKRDSKRSNSTMTIFNRNSRSEDDSNQFILSSPKTPDNNDPIANNHTFHPNSSLTMRGMIASNKNSTGSLDRSNGSDHLAGTKQPILTAIDAAHAVSPNATNSDKLVLFLNPNGDSLKGSSALEHKNNHHPTTKQPLNNAHATSQHQHHHPYQHDPILMAASQAINATQEMTQGRRTSSLKASYAAVNSGIQTFDQSAGLVEIYCKCRSLIQGSNMIACDNSKCKIEWFHYECVGITTPPEGEWYCEDCRSSLLSNQPMGQLRS